MSERIYYAVASDSPVMDVIRAAEEKQRLFHEAMAALGKEFGGDTWTSGRTRFEGISFPGGTPKEWRQKGKYAVPNGRSKAGKALAERFRKLPRGVDGWMLGSMMGEAFPGHDFIHWGDNKVSWPTYEKHGERLVLNVPLPCAFAIPGCTELKMSEYWAIREKAGAEAEEVAA